MKYHKIDRTNSKLLYRITTLDTTTKLKEEIEEKKFEKADKWRFQDNM